MTDTPGQVETKMQRIQRLQAERLEQMARGAVETPKPSSDVPTPLPVAIATPCKDRPDPETLWGLNQARLTAKDGADLRIAAALIVTVCQPMIEKLVAEATSAPEPFKSELVFWASCLSAGVFPHAPKKPEGELTDFQSWFYSSIPSITPEGVIENWRTL